MVKKVYRMPATCNDFTRLVRNLNATCMNMGNLHESYYFWETYTKLKKIPQFHRLKKGECGFGESRKSQKKMCHILVPPRMHVVCERLCVQTALQVVG